ncbi:MAG: DUF58 domain-containing protein, partial [Ginsengibacter sp.]
MSILKKYIWDLFVSSRFYMGLAACVVLFIAAFYVPALEAVALSCFLFFIMLTAIDYSFLFFTKGKVVGQRITTGRLSNGDENRVEIITRNKFHFHLHLTVIDELPVQFQLRSQHHKVYLKSRSSKRMIYTVRPVERGAYHFGNIHLFAAGPVGIVVRRFSVEAEETIPVYPSFLQLHKYELLSGTVLQREAGSARLRRIGQSMEFEQIREYVGGDDVRTLNWKASARKGNLMINNFMEERSQQVYCIIDKGRLMKMPFAGLTLLDHAINSCLVLSNVCLKKQDRVGLITFSNVIGSVLAADRKPIQRNNILQTLYNQKTGFLESDFEMLYMEIRNRIRHRSLVILFTNFESLSGLNRQLEYLRAMANHHLLLVVFFENTELNKLIERKSTDIEEVYIKTVAEKFAFEKRLIAKELAKYGILSVLSTP